MSESKTDNISARFHIVPDLLLLFRLAVIYCSAVLQNYHLTCTAEGQRAGLAFTAAALILGLVSLRFELWFHFDWIEQINSHSIQSLGNTQRTQRHAGVCAWRVRGGGCNMMRHLRPSIAYKVDVFCAKGTIWVHPFATHYKRLSITICLRYVNHPWHISITVLCIEMQKYFHTHTQTTVSMDVSLSLLLVTVDKQRLLSCQSDAGEAYFLSQLSTLFNMLMDPCTGCDADVHSWIQYAQPKHTLIHEIMKLV